MVVTPEARPAPIAFGVERGWIAVSAPAMSQRPTKASVVTAITIEIAR